MQHTDDNMVAVILAGGAGTRFWPLSTEARPKQFLRLFDDRSLLQKSFDRIVDLIPPRRILILTNAASVNLTREHLPQMPAENIIGEPMRRDTAAAVALGAVLCRRRYGNPVIATLTADHMIDPVAVFQETLLSAVRFARSSGALYTFGIPPSYPATGYGYLELGQQLAEECGIKHFQLLQFKEKPDLKTARTYFASKKFYWNSGMFVWTADAILRELATHLPNHLHTLSRACELDGTPSWPEALGTAFACLETISIDYAVMEKAREVRSVVSTFTWSDVGGWLGMRDFLPRDADGNCHRADLAALNATDNLIFCEDPTEQVMLIGVKELVVVRAGPKTLVVQKDQLQDIKTLLHQREDLR